MESQAEPSGPPRWEDGTAEANTATAGRAESRRGQAAWRESAGDLRRVPASLPPSTEQPRMWAGKEDPTGAEGAFSKLAWARSGSPSQHPERSGLLMHRVSGRDSKRHCLAFPSGPRPQRVLRLQKRLVSVPSAAAERRSGWIPARQTKSPVPTPASRSGSGSKTQADHPEGGSMAGKLFGLPEGQASGRWRERSSRPCSNVREGEPGEGAEGLCRLLRSCRESKKLAHRARPARTRERRALCSETDGLSWNTCTSPARPGAPEASGRPGRGRRPQAQGAREGREERPGPRRRPSRLCPRRKRKRPGNKSPCLWSVRVASATARISSS